MTLTLMSEEFAGDDGRDKHRLVYLELRLLQITEELRDDGAQCVYAHDREEQVKGLGEELQGLRLSSRSDQLVLWTLDLHQLTCRVQ